MRIRTKKWMRLCAGLVLVCLLAAVAFPLGQTATAADDDALSADQIVVYNNAGGQTVVYILTQGNSTDATYRVYTASGALTGQAQQEPNFAYCAVRLRTVYQEGARLRVTRTLADGGVSSVWVKCPAEKSPSVQLRMAQVASPDAELPTTAAEEAAYLGETIAAGSSLQAGAFYQVQVSLHGFEKLDSVVLPIRYDTAYLEPADVTDGLAASQTLSQAASGKTFNVPDWKLGVNFGFGIVPGYNLTSWSDGTYTAAFASATTGGSYQYLNTTTGLIKLDVGLTQPAAADGIQVVRVFFRAKQSASLTQLPVWFATEADCPAEYLSSDTVKIRYYDTASPDGALPTLAGANVLSPPLVLEAADSGTETSPVTLTAENLTDLPDSYYNAVTRTMSSTSSAIAGAVRFYNYTNTSAQGDGFGTLDADLDDLCVITETTSLKAGDTVRVSLLQNGSYVVIGSTTLEYDTNLETVTTIYLGRGNLLPEGGTAYLSVVHEGNTSPMTSAEYPAEDSRDVTIAICRSGWAEDHETAQSTAGLWSYDPLAEGEQVQLQIYFNNFSDLMSYGLAIRFNPAVVQVADLQYQAMPTGTVSEASYKAGESCFSVGADLANVTLTEQVVYQAAQRSDESAIADLMAQLGLTREEFDQMARDVEVKYAVGVTEESDGALAWKGGLLFTGDRGDGSDLPYVNNSAGCIQLMSASLVKPPLRLQREGDGYHFLSIRFTAVGTGNPAFALATAAADPYCATIPKGAEVMLAGGSETVGVSSHWDVRPLSVQAKLRLTPGNALPADDDESAVFLYAGAAFRDPGFAAQDEFGAAASTEDVTRWFVNAAGTPVTLPAYDPEEAIAGFTLPEDAPSMTYSLVYEYATLQVVRTVYVICPKGDVNRDGVINLFDEQALASHLNEARPLDLTDALYRTHTVDVDGSGAVDAADRAAIRQHSLGLAAIEQDYGTPIPAS